MAKNFAPKVNIENVYPYNAHRNILTEQQWIGTYDLNSTIKASATPRKCLEKSEILPDESAAGVADIEKGTTWAN